MAVTDTTRRRAQLAAVLVVKGITQTQLAAQLGVNDGHLSRVLSGKRESARLVEAIDRFIQKNALKGQGYAGRGAA